MDRDSDARPGLDLIARNREWLGQCVQKFACQDRRIRRIFQIALEDGELVAAESRDNVGWTDTTLEPGGDRLQQQITHRVTQGVVDAFEMIQIDSTRPQTSFRPCRLVPMRAPVPRQRQPDSAIRSTRHFGPAEGSSARPLDAR